MALQPTNNSKRLAELGYSDKYSRLELTMPHGTKVKDLTKLLDRFGDFSGRLPRGCEACISGESLIIRERLEHVLPIDLDTMQVLK